MFILHLSMILPWKMAKPGYPALAHTSWYVWVVAKANVAQSNSTGGKKRQLTLQISIHNLDKHGVVNTVVPLPYAPASVVDAAIHSVDEPLLAQKGKVYNDLTYLFRSLVLGMLQLVV
jgi:hypothetical protein